MTDLERFELYIRRQAANAGLTTERRSVLEELARKLATGDWRKELGDGR